MLRHDLILAVGRSRAISTASRAKGFFGPGDAVDLALKRGFDFSIAFAALLLLLPIIALVHLAIWAVDGAAPFYSHRRRGLNEKMFGCLNLRSVRTNGDAIPQKYCADNPTAMAGWTQARRLKRSSQNTVVGHVLRRSSLDELQQLISVFRGEMSSSGRVRSCKPRSRSMGMRRWPILLWVPV